MRSRVLWLWATLSGLTTSACALAGYDFDQYRPDSPDAAATTFSSLGGAAEVPLAGAASHAGGAAGEGGAAAAAEGGSVAGGEGGAAATGEGGTAGKCEPRGCFTLPASCGVVDDGCGKQLDCGECFWWFEECRQHVCEISQ
jgi:hypothetical protein